MAENYLITGYWGTPHVTAENDRGINAGTFGAGRFVLPVGKQFLAEYVGNNTVRIYDGKLIDNGAAAGIPAGEYIDIVIPNAGQGKKRNDLIVFQYSKEASTLVETGEFILVQGSETTGTPADPALTQSDLLSGTATADQMALWRVTVESATISKLTKVFQVRSLVSADGAISIQQGGTGKTTAAEALVALGAVAKAGDTMTGHLHIGTSGYPTVYFEDGEGESCGSVFASASNKRTYLRCYATDDSGFYENFRAPAANNGLTANKTYDILTTKTVTYGTKDPETAVGAAGIAGRIYFKKVT